MSRETRARDPGAQGRARTVAVAIAIAVAPSGATGAAVLGSVQGVRCGDTLGRSRQLPPAQGLAPTVRRRL